MNPMFYTILIVSLLLLAKIIMKIVYVMRVSANNTVFFKEPHIMKKSIKLPDIHFPQSDADVRFYYQFNLYLPDYKQFLDKPKNILLKGTIQQCSPGIWLLPNNNDILIRIATDGNRYSDIGFQNIPLRRWFTFSLYVNNMNVELYMDGYLVKSITLNGMPLTNNKYVELASEYTFNGMLNNLLYSNNKLSPTDINDFYNIYKKLVHPKWSPFKKDDMTVCSSQGSGDDEKDEDIYGTFGKSVNGEDNIDADIDNMENKFSFMKGDMKMSDDMEMPGDGVDMEMPDGDMDMGMTDNLPN